MLPQKIALDVVTAERRVFTDEVDEVMLPGTVGYLGVRPGHTPLLTGLGTGVLTFWKGGQEQRMAVSLGFAEVLPDRIEVLAETAELPADIDSERAGASRDRARERLSTLDSEIDITRAQAALNRALARLSVAGQD
jgi:F-type H+-transporting ATPase subunit epsilon